MGIAYEAARFRVIRQMSDGIKVATNFVQSLALTSVQMVGYMQNTSLVPDKQVPCMAAGLPHFSNDYMRCWGRDVFIAFRGLLIVTGRYDDAKQHILGFAKTLKHGLILIYWMLDVILVIMLEMQHGFLTSDSRICYLCS